MTQHKPRGGGALVGYGGGKGGGGGGGVKEAPDSLHSTQYARILDVIGVGPTGGPYSGDAFVRRDVFFNGTPVENEDGSINWPDIEIHWRLGTQNQDPIPGFPVSENTVAVGVELKMATPWAQQITNADLSAVRITLATDKLTTQDAEEAEIKGASVEYAIDLSIEGGAFSEVMRGAMAGKATNRYTRTHRIDLPPRSSYWTIRVRRLTPDSTSSLVENRLYIDALTEVVDGNLRYPMMAMMGYLIPAHLFSSIPTRAVRWKGREIRIPSNYDPVTRAYTGTWDGTFKLGVCSNPAWVLLDIWTNDIFGLGQRVDVGMHNRYALYKIAQYCDELVPDGLGGMEPRFRIVGQLRTRADARKVLQDIASAFHGMSYEMGGVVETVADMPQDPVYTYSAANVVGEFSYTGTKRSTRYTVALVSYSNVDDFGRQKVEAVEDPEGIERYGVRELQVPTFLNVSRGQAIRMGKWALLTSRMQTRGVNFTVGLERAVAAPGKIIEIADNVLAGAAIGGRIYSVVDAREIVLDRAARVKAGDTLTLNLPAGFSEERVVSSAAIENDGSEEARTRVRVTADYSELPQVESGWNVGAIDLKPQQFRVLGIRRKGKMEAEITAVEAVPGKHAAVDYGTQLDPLPSTIVPSRVMAPPTDVRISAHSAVDQQRAVHALRIEWKGSVDAQSYDVQWRRNSGNWISIPGIAEQSVEIEGIRAGLYQARVRAVSPLQIRSSWVSSEAQQLDGDLAPPPAVVMLTTEPLLFGIRVNWGYPASSSSPIHHTEIWVSSNPSSMPQHKLTDVVWPATSYEIGGLPAGAEMWFWARGVDTLGESGPFYPAEGAIGIYGQTSTDAKAYLDPIKDEVLSSDLGKQLLSDINSINIDIMNLLAGVGDVDGVLSDLKGKDGELADSILAEARRRATEVAAAVQQILDEAAARVAQGQQLSQDLLIEVTARTNQYAALAQDILNEANSRASAVQDVADSVVAEASARTDAINDASSVLGARIDALNSDMASILGAEEYSASTTYAEGNLVTYSGKLYRAKQSTTGNVPTDATYWELVGNYDSIGSAVADLSSRMESAELVQANHATRLQGVESESADSQSRIQTVEQTQATDAARLQTVETKAANSESAISILQTTQSDQAQIIASLTSTANNLTGRMQTVEMVSNNLVERTSSLEVEAEDTKSRVLTVERATETFALQLINLSATLGETDGELTELRGVSGEHAFILQKLQVSNAISTSQIQNLLDVTAGHTTQLSSMTTRVGANESAIQSVQETQLDHASDISQLATRMGNAESSITSVRQTAEGAASVASALSVTVGQHATKISNIQDVVDGHASAISGLTTTTGNNTAAIAAEAQTRANAVDALSQRVDTVTSKADDNAAAITAEVTTRANADTALSQQVTTLTGRMEGAESAITAENSARVSADLAITESVSTLTSQVNANASAIVDESNARADADGALSTRITAAQAKADTAAAAVQTETEARADADGSTAMQLLNLLASFGDADGELLELRNVASDHAEFIRLLRVRSDDLLAAVKTEEQARITQNEALAQQISTVATQAGNNASAIQSEATARTNADDALSTRIDTVTAKAGDNEAAIQFESEARADLEGNLSAMATLKSQVTVDGKRYYAGIGFGVENDPGGDGFQSQILFQADRIGAINASNGNVTLPFVIQGGQVFINQALIGTAWIKDGNIENLDGDKIWANTIRAEQIDAWSVASKMATTDYAYIGTANIGVAQVDTLRIAGQAVTVPIVWEGTLDGTGGTVYLPTDAAGPLIIFVTTDSYTDTDGGRRLQILLDGAVRVEKGLTYVERDSNEIAPTFSMFGVNVGAGGHTVTVKRSTDWAHPGFMRFFVLVAKR